jgi:mannitol-1-phosphate 5-dehydrogenase
MKVLIYGAGAIGRGFLAPLLGKLGISISFVDINTEVVNQLKVNKSYVAAITLNDGYEFVDVEVESTYLLGEEDDHIKEYDIIFSCVGPDQCLDLSEKFSKAKIVISCENDISTAEKLRKLSGNKNIYFGIPDVITSNTAPEYLLDKDALTTVSEQGILVLEKGKYSLPDEIIQVSFDDLEMHWMCKMFIHNAPHAVVAYLGALKGYKYIHESMNDIKINKIVVGSINEITKGVIKAGYASLSYANSYRAKELSRFSNTYLHDTIERVAREPVRKLSSDNRLILGMRIVQFNGESPRYTAIGAKAALMYHNDNDSQAEYILNLRNSTGDLNALSKVSKLEVYDPLCSYVVNQDIDIYN